MTFFSTFVLTYGLLLASMAVIAAWVFRSSMAPLWAKVWFCRSSRRGRLRGAVRSDPMLGFPVSVSVAALPERAQLLAFLPHDEGCLVDLWLLSGDGPPRAYETRLDKG